MCYNVTKNVKHLFKQSIGLQTLLLNLHLGNMLSSYLVY